VPGSPGRRRLISAGIAIAAILLVAGLAVWRSRASASRGAIHSLTVLPLEISPVILLRSILPTRDRGADHGTRQVPSLRVISRISAMQYRAKRKSAPEIAGELHVDALVEGSVARSGNHVRITAQLIEAKNDRHLWPRVSKAS